MLLRGLPIHPGTCALQSEVYQAGELIGYQFAIKLGNDGSEISTRANSPVFRLEVVALETPE